MTVPPGQSRSRRITLRALLVGASIVAAVLAVEVALRIWPPWSLRHAAEELPWFRESDDARQLFTLDPELGFRPILDSALYDPHGTRRNGYALAKPPDRTRLLFVGDSVTARGRIIDALRARFGDARFEYWNAGVESFNTVQEATYYERYNRGVEPDHVVLTFHFNDFETTPVVFRDDAGHLVVHAPHHPLADMSPWLFEHSLLYRLWLAREARTPGAGRAAIVAETERALRRLRDAVRADGARFSMLVLPPLGPRVEWADDDRTSYETALAFGAKLDIRCFGLAEPLARALAEGVEPCEMPGDRFHPSAELAAVFAAHLEATGLLAE